MTFRLVVDNQARRRISLFLVFMQSIGIRFFGGFGFSLLILLLVLNWNRTGRLNRIRRPQTLVLLMVLIIIINLVKGFTALSIIYLILAFICSVLVLLSYVDNYQVFIDDLKSVLIFFSAYGFISWFVLLLFPDLFHSINLGGMNYSTLAFLLYNNRPAFEIPRLSSLLWEPGCCQFVLNLLLLIFVTEKKSPYKLAAIAFLVLVTKSTTGYLNLFAIIIYYVVLNKNNFLKSKYVVLVIIIFSCIMSLGLFSMMTGNISDKFANSSGIIRARDFYVGLNLIASHPLLGVDTESLQTNPEAQVLEDEVWGGPIVWTATKGYFAGGYTNGFMAIFLDYGLILGLILYLFTLKAPIIWNNHRFLNPIIFYVIYFCSLTGEPISRTSMFFFFALSFLVNMDDRKRSIVCD